MKDMLHQFPRDLKFNDNSFWRPPYWSPNPLKSTYYDDKTAAAFVETTAKIIAQTLSFPIDNWDRKLLSTFEESTEASEASLEELNCYRCSINWRIAISPATKTLFLIILKETLEISNYLVAFRIRICFSTVVYKLYHVDFFMILIVNA